jgi:hypothetical protein
VSLAAGVCVALGLAAVFAPRLWSARTSPRASETDHAGGLRFTDEAEKRGLRFRLGHGGKTPLNIRETLGTGAALWDYDGDGWLDLYLVGQRGASATGGGALFRNRGDGTFEDRTAGSGLGLPGNWHGCASGDFDNDGRPDLLLTGLGDCRLFRNLGGGRFGDVTRGSGLEAPSPLAWATSAGFADVNRDGLLDLFVGRYVRFGPKDLQLCSHSGVIAACGPRSYDPQFGSLYLNRGKGRFADVTRRFGLGDQHGKCLGVAFGDANDDGYPDLYLANDEMPGDLYLNLAGRSFRNIGVSSGTAMSAGGGEQAGMGVDWADYDRDGRLDLFVTTFQGEDNSLYRNLGDDAFEESGGAAGLSGVTRPFVAFGTRFVDLDNDGWLDLWAVNGHMKDNVAEIDRTTTYRQRSQVLRNVDGRRFVEVRGEKAGEVLDRPLVGRALATGDIDNDGDQDLLVSDLEGAALLIVNRTAAPGNWISVRLAGARSNRMALGARVTVKAGDRAYVQECQTGSSFLSASDPRVHVGVGPATVVDVEVRWPDGRITRRSGVRTNQQLTMREQ